MLSYHHSCQSCFHLENNLISIGNQGRFLFQYRVQKAIQGGCCQVSGKKVTNKNPYKSAYKVSIFPSVNSLKNNLVILLASERKIRMFCICMEWIIGQNLTIMNCYVENTDTVYKYMP